MKSSKFDDRIARGTNINAIEVPEQMRHKVPTGIGWIDDFLAGGFTPSTVGFVYGESGCGKSTFVRTLADSLTAQGHAVLYNCTEESPIQVKMANERLELRRGFVIAEDHMIDDVVEHARYLQDSLPVGKRVITICDSLQEHDDGHFSDGRITSNSTIRCASRLKEWAKETFNVVLWVNKVNKDGSYVGKNDLKHLTDYILRLGFDLDKKSETYGERILSKEKDRFGKPVEPLVVELGTGGKIAPKPLFVPEGDDDGTFGSYSS